MHNPVFNHLSQQLALAVGGSEHLASGRGTRFRTVWFTRLTAYHENVAEGNNAEVAFHPQSLGQSTGISETDIRLQINHLRASTAREINFNLQQRWPRVGVRTAEDVALVIAFIDSMLAIARTRRQRVAA